MSSLRLALKQSLEESGGILPDPPKKKKKKAAQRRKPPPRKPGDPPRKRGRPRKHPLPEEKPPELPPEEESSSDEENEFQSGQESEEEDESEEEQQTQPKRKEPSGLFEDSSDSESDHEHERAKLQKQKQDSAANKIQSQWKKKKDTPPKETNDEPEESNKLTAAASKPIERLMKKKKKKKSSSSSKAQTVPPPAPQIVEWMRNLPIKKQRRNIAKGLRLKVRFGTKVKKRDGKIVRRLKWYGGLVAAVKPDGSKIRIKYDDGTSEVSKFPDKDVIVDDEGNGRHLESATAFIPPDDAFEEEEDEVPAVVENKSTVPDTDSKKSAIVDLKKAASPTTDSEREKKSESSKATGKVKDESKGEPSVKISVTTEAKDSDQDGKEPKPAAITSSKPSLKIRLIAPKRKKQREASDLSSSKIVDRANGDHLSVEGIGSTEACEEPQKVTVNPVETQEGRDLHNETSGAKRHRENEDYIVDQPPAKKIDIGSERDTHVNHSDTSQEVEALKSKMPTSQPKEDQESASEPKAESESKKPFLDSEKKDTGSSLASKRITDESVSSDGPTDLSSSPKSFESPKSAKKIVSTSGLLKPVSTVADSTLGTCDKVENLQEGLTLQSSTNSAFVRKAGASIKEVTRDIEKIDDGSREGQALSPIPSNSTDEPNSPYPRSGRRAAQQANERIAARQEIVIQDPYSKTKRKREKTELFSAMESKRKSKIELSGDEDDRDWVQCDKCHKWRILPSNVQIEKLPKHWYCEMNVYDQLRNSCDAPEQTQEEVRKERKKAKRKALRLARKRAAELASISNDAAQRPMPKKAKIKDRLVSSSPTNVNGAEECKRSLEGSGESRCHSPVSDGEHEPRNAPIRKQSSFGSTGRRSRGYNDDDEALPAEAEGVNDSVIGKGKGRSRGRSRNSKDAETGKPGTAQESQDEDQQEWVMCEKCNKWRRLPPHISSDTLPEVWYCTMNTWHPASASCDAPEDNAEPNTREYGIYGSSVGATYSNKLSYRNLIFGTAGRKQNRPVSERTRAAESLFATSDDSTTDGGGYPKVMYANSSVFLPRGQKSTNEDTSRKISIFDLMSRSALWTELWGASIMADAAAKASPTMSDNVNNSFTPNQSDPEKKCILKEIVYHALGTNTLAGHQVLLEAQCRQWEKVPAEWSAIRPWCTVHNVVEALLDLAKEGRVEVVSPGSSGHVDGIPRYRRIQAPKSQSLNEMDSADSPRYSRCMKIAKPWKLGLPMA